MVHGFQPAMWLMTPEGRSILGVRGMPKMGAAFSVSEECWYSNFINHPPFITIFKDGINHQKLVVYDLAIPTLVELT